MKKCPICDRSFSDEVKTCEFDGSILRNAQQTQDPFLGKVVRDRYRVIEKIGHGSMSDVYLAEHLQIGRKVLLKVLSIEYASNEAFVRRFRQEAKVISSLNHARLIQLFDFDQTEDGRLFIVTEYVQGRSLKQILETEVVEIPRVVRLAVQLAEGLDAAHSAGVIHRDINPENIVVINDRDDIKITDFGFARSREAEATVRLTQLGTILGNPSYVAPEQIEGYETDERTDIYSLGIVLYEMLCGAVPFIAASPAAVWMKHLNDQPIPPTSLRPDIPLQLEKIVLRALQKKPEQRWPRMSNLADALRDANRELALKPPMQKIATTRTSNSVRTASSSAQPPSNHRSLEAAAEKREPLRDDISKTVVVENFDPRSLNLESSGSDMSTPRSISETLVMTQAMDVIQRKETNWKWLALAGVLLIVAALASWFAYFANRPGMQQVSSESVVLPPMKSGPPIEIAAVSIGTEKSELFVGERAELRLTARYTDGSIKSVQETGDISWTSTNPSVATSDARGEIDARRVGTTKFTARYMGLETSPIAITVKPSASQGLAEPKLVSLAIKGGRRELTQRERLRLRVFGKYSDGQDREIKSDVRWESITPEIATIDPKGTVLGQKEGRAELVARYGEISSEPLSLMIKPSLTDKKSEVRASKAVHPMKTAIVEERIKIARIHLDRGEYAEALNELGKARKIDPSNKDLQTAISETERACNAEKKLGRSDLKC